MGNDEPTPGESHELGPFSRNLLESVIARAWDIKDPAVVQQFAKIATLRVLSAGEVLTHEGEVADSAFLVISGTLTVTRSDSDEPVAVHPGEFVGERALLDTTHRSATLTARRETTVAEFAGSAFVTLALTHPQVLLATTRHIIGRDDAKRRRESYPQRIAFVGDGTCRLEELVRCIAAHFPFPARVITSTDVSNATDALPSDVAERHPTDQRSGALSRWLDEQEDATTWLLLAIDGTVHSSRHRELVAMSDHVVAVTAPNGGLPRNHPVWENSNRPVQPTTLLLVHPPHTRMPLNTARILQRLPADAHQHTQEGNEKHYARIARTLAGVPIGLVLSGGGARGFAHLGAMRSMDELGLPIDLVGGTSIGAVMGLYLGFETTQSQRIEQTERDFQGLFDYTLPVVSVLSGKRTSERLIRFTEGHDIEDLWIPYFCVSTNLSTNDTMIHRTGQIATAVRASLALPGIFPPVPFNGDFLVDGGVLNNFPLDVMRSINPRGKVVAIDVAANVPFEARGGFGMELSGFRAALEAARKLPLAPSLAKTLIRTSIIGSARDRNRYVQLQYADLHLELPLAGVGLLDFDKTREVAEFGYRASHDKLSSWWSAQA